MNGPSDDGKHTSREFEKLMREAAGIPSRPDELRKADPRNWPVRVMVPPAPGAPIASIPHCYPDAHDFDRETDGNDVCHVLHIDCNTDRFDVRNQGSGVTYRMTARQAIERGMGQYIPGEQFTLNKGLAKIGNVPLHRIQIAIDPSGPISDAIKVHIVHQGQPLCHFTSLRLVDWPKGHEQLSLDAVRQAWAVEGASCGATCNDCIEATRHLLQP